MPEAVDVGSVLGGRYKVTAYVLASAEKDLVLDGVDQVLNRPVSILVASDGHASQVATSARELATGDRNGSVQVLDLSITDGGTYLVTNRSPAPDMLDLIVQQNPRAQSPYVEPFFTDTLGSEIFGGPRSTEPETYDDDDDYEEYDDDRQPRRSRLAGLRSRFGRRAAPDDDARDDDTSSLPPVPAEPAPRLSNHRVPPPPSQRPGGATPAVGGTRDREDQRDDSAQDTARRRHDDGERRRAGAGLAGAAGVGAGVGAAAAATSSRQAERSPSRFPLSNRDDEYDTSADPEAYDRGEYDDDDDRSGGSTFTRLLVGVVMTIVVVAAVFFAATNLSSISGGAPVADTDGSEPVATTPAAAAPTTPPPTPTTEPTPEAVAPSVAGITRLVPGNPGMDAANDGTLPLIIDGNPSTYWGNQVYASDTFGGLATNLALVVELEEESTISQVSIAQLNGSGGSFTVLVNDQPVLEGAQQIAQGGFTGPNVSLPIPDGADGAPTGRYVLVNFTQLPRLSNIQAQYPFGLRVAEISVN